MIRFNIRSRNKQQSPTAAFQRNSKRSLEISRDFLMLRNREKPNHHSKDQCLSNLSYNTPNSPIDISSLQISQPSSINSQLDLTAQPVSLPCFPSPAHPIRRNSLPTPSLDTYINRFALCTAYDTLSSNSTYLVSNATLPKRDSSGYALDYYSYTPSSQNSTNSSKTRRRVRPTTKRKSSKQSFNKLAKSSVDIGLDFDSLARRRKLGGDQLDFIPIEKRILSKTIQLRRLLNQVEHIGDFEELKELVTIHESKISSSKKQIVTAKERIREANILIQTINNTVNTNGISLRRVHGKPNHFRSRRTDSALRESTEFPPTPNTLTNQRSFDHDIVLGTHQQLSPSEQRRFKPDVHKASRKSSKLRRLGSAGSTFLRRLSKGSHMDESSLGSRREPFTPVVLDEDTIERLKLNPEQGMEELQNKLHSLIEAEHVDAVKLKEAQNKLAEKRDIHDRIMEILDLFYGNTPGWEENPISQAMFTEIADMTEAGLEAEHDLVDFRLLLNRARAAFEDYVLGANAMLVVTHELTFFVQKLGALMVSVDESEPIFLMDGTIESKNEELHRTILRDMDGHITKTYSKSRVAAESCVGAPRVARVKADLQKLKSIFDAEVSAVEDSESVCQCDLQTMMQMSRNALSESRTAEMFVIERRNLMGEDLVKIESQVDRCEEYVIMERLGILDLHHPPDEM